MEEQSPVVATCFDELIAAAAKIRKALDSTGWNEKGMLAIQTWLETVTPNAVSYLKSRVIAERIDMLKVAQLEKTATDIWNTSTISSKLDNEKKVELLLNQIRVFAILLLQVEATVSPGVNKKLRIAYCLIRLFASCLDCNDFECAKTVQGYANQVQQKLNSMKEENVAKEKDINQCGISLLFLNLNYYLCTSDYKQAKIYESKLDSLVLSEIDVSILLRTCCTLYNSSLLLFESNNVDEALHFIQTSTDCFELKGNTFDNFKDYNEIKIKSNILLARCLQKRTDKDSMTKLQSTISSLQTNFPLSLEVYLLAIEIMNQNEGMTQKLQDLIQNMLSSVAVIDNFDRILNIFKYMAQSRSSEIVHFLDYIFATKLDSTKNHDKLEILITTRICITSMDTKADTNLKIGDVSTFMKLAEEKIVSPLSKQTRSSVLTIFWNQGSIAVKAKLYEQALEWLSLCLNPLLVSAADMSSERAKVARMMQNCYIKISQFQSAIHIIESITESERENILTQYYLFKSFINLNDEANALKCIDKIYATNDKLRTIVISSCIIESKELLSHNGIIKTMTGLLNVLVGENISSDKISNICQAQDLISIPAAIRYTICMTLKEIENNSKKLDQYVEILQGLFNQCYSLAEYLSMGDKYTREKLPIFEMNDVEWFSSKAYNIACICLKNKMMSHCITFSKHSSAFTNLVIGSCSQNESISIRGVKANILTMLALSLKEDSDESIKWGKIRDESLKIKEKICYSLRQSNCSGDSRKQWVKSLLQVFLFQFQAELILKEYSHLEEIIVESQEIPSELIPDLYITFVNFLMNNVSITIELRNRILEKLILKCMLSDSQLLNVEVVKWIKIIFEYIVVDDKLCEQVFDNFFVALKHKKLTFPPYEIEWLATSCWNYGVSIIISRNTENGTTWCAKSIMMAKIANPTLESHLKVLWIELAKSQDISPESLHLSLDK